MNNKAEAAKRLMDNKDFQELILEDFIKAGVLTYTLQHNTRSEPILDELIARRILHEYFFDIITNGEQPKN